MQEKQIHIGGINNTPYSETSPDGQCAVLHNLELHNGGVRPTTLSGTQYKHTSGFKNMKLACTHEKDTYRHFIFTSPEGSWPAKIYWYNISDIGTESHGVRTIDSIDCEIYGVKAVGNLLIVATAEGVRYYQWESDVYEYIGDHIPDIGLIFNLYRETNLLVSGEMGEGGFYTSKIDEAISFPSEEIMTFSNAFYAALGKIDESINKLKIFRTPFFVRYAYTLYDGEKINFSHPVFINADSPIWQNRDLHDNDKLLSISVIRLRLMMMVDDLGDISNFKDIITSVDIYITPPLYSLDTSNVYWPRNFESNARISKTIQYSSEFFDEDGNVTYQPSKQVYKGKITSVKEETLEGSVKLVYSKNSLEIMSKMQFYKVASYTIDELESMCGNGFFQELKYLNSNLSNLVQFESLDESNDYISHDKIIAKKMYSYNSKIHLYDIDRYLFKGFRFDYMNQFITNGSTSGDMLIESDGDYYYCSAESFVYIKENNETIIIKNDSSKYKINSWGPFIYYPNPNAYKMVVFHKNDLYEFPLKVHPVLNGSYYWAYEYTDQIGYKELNIKYIEQSEKKYVSYKNRIYVSDANNPFVYNSNSVYTFGTGTILGIGSIATPLSTGQLGQFALMVFCDTGNFAIKVDDEGNYTIPSAIQRDVCYNEDSITTLDSEILYLSSRGPVVTDASSMNLLSNMLDGRAEASPVTFDASAIAIGSNNTETSGEDTDDNASFDEVSVVKPTVGNGQTALSESTWGYKTTINDLVKSNNIAYDYNNKRIIFFHSDGSANIYTLDTQVWSTARFPIVRTVLNVYPYSYIQLEEDGRIVQLDKPSSYDSESDYQGIIYTRPMKLDSYSLKRIRQYRLEGDNFSAKVYMYGSMDCVNWHLIGTSTSMSVHNIVGHPYKYFRFAIVVDSMKEYGNISGMRIGFTTDKERRFR
jgi:hypothetical protein